MRIRFAWAVLIAISIVPTIPSTSPAGPYFNTTRKEIDAASREAVKQLSDARILVIQMLTDLDMGQFERARNERVQAVKLLESSHAQFQDIEAKVPNQPLKLAPKSDDEKKVVADFADALAARKLDFPKTEKQLAHLAVIVVIRYSTTIEKANLEGFPKNWRGVRDIILSEIDLLTIGNLVSIAWIISE